MITSRGAHLMKSAAISLDNYSHDVNEDALLNEVSGVHSRNNGNGNGNKHYGISNNINHNETTLWSKAHDMQASSNANNNPVLRSINNDMTKGIPRKTHQCKSKFPHSAC